MVCQKGPGGTFRDFPGFSAKLLRVQQPTTRGIPVASGRGMKLTGTVPAEAPIGYSTVTHKAMGGVARRQLRVWVVVENSALRGLFSQLLSQQPGIRCTRQFASAESILATLKEERPPDLVLLDVHLGQQSGLAAIRPIRKLAPKVRVLMLSMFSNSYYEAEAFRAGASGFLLKSYELAELTTLIHLAYRKPAAPALFPNLAQQQEAESRLTVLERKARNLKRQFNIIGTIRRLCRGPRNQPAG